MTAKRKFKQIITTTISFWTILLFAQCDLTLLPEDSISPETFFGSANDLQLWTNQFYTMLDHADNAAERNADDVIDRNFQDVVAGTRSPSTEGGWNWSQLRRIHYYLENSHQCLDKNARDQYDGVAYFFKAYFYFEKVKRYGDVPWYDQVIFSNDEALLKKPRDDRGLVMDSVMSCFNKAIDLLPSTKSTSRVTKWTALAFKSRAALYEGTFRKYHGLPDAEKYLQKAATSSREFIENSGYSLYNEGGEPYRDLFSSDQAKTEEIVLARIYNFPDLNIPTSIQGNIVNLRQGFTKRFINHYLMSNGQCFSTSTGYQTKTYVEEVESRDPRLRQTILTPGYVQKGNKQPTRNELLAATGYQPIKFVATTAQDGASKGTADFPLMRSAEVFLNYAEAKAELGTLTQDDIELSVNKIRERANMPGLNLIVANSNPDELLQTYYPNVTISQNTGVILEIRRERTVELVMEGNRQWDMLRWKEGQQIVNVPNPFYGCYFPGPGLYDMDNDGINDLELYTNVATSNISNKKMIGSDVLLSEGAFGYIVAFPTVETTWNEGRDYLWPIPADQRVLTQGILTQNPGWEDGLDF